MPLYENKFLEKTVGVNVFTRASGTPGELEYVWIVDGLEYSWFGPDDRVLAVYFGGTGDYPSWESKPRMRGKNFYIGVPRGTWFKVEAEPEVVEEKKPPEEMKVLFGYVRDHDTKVGIPDAKVILKDRFGNVVKTVTTNAEGYYEATLDMSMVGSVRVEAEGYEPAEFPDIPFDPANPQSLDVFLVKIKPPEVVPEEIKGLSKEEVIRLLNSINIANEAEAIEAIQKHFGVSREEAETVYREVSGAVTRFDPSLLIDLGFLALGAAGIIA
ncbi:carboxypeptidase regulatory-like domain-containing protein, partial [bacterium]|nr:carboxypeptidase regulatory-like domain-containing protein [bacterium]